MSGVHVGVVLPAPEAAGAAEASPLLRTARRIEELGYDGVWAGDSPPARGRLEPLTLLAAVAAVTERVTIGTAPLIVPPRDPLALAHAIATLDRLSGGRLRMFLAAGLPLPAGPGGTGGPGPDREAGAGREPGREPGHGLGPGPGYGPGPDIPETAFGERVARMDEMAEGWQVAWNEEDGDLVGAYYDLRRLCDQPMPLQPGGPALWLTCNDGPRAVGRIARHYAGWMPVRVTPDEYAADWLAIAAELTAIGRDPESVARGLYATVHIDDDADRARTGLEDYARRHDGLPFSAMSGRQLYFGGSTKACAAWLTSYAEAGARQIVLRVGASGGYERHLRALADEVVPALHAWAE